MENKMDRLKIGFNVVAMVALSLVLCVMVNYLAFRHHGRIDVTRSHKYTVSETTLAVLRDLKTDLGITVFLVPDDVLYDPVTELLKGFSAASSKVRVEIIDPDRDRARTKVLSEKFGVRSANVVVFQLGDRNKYVSRNEMADFEYAQPGAGQSIKTLKAEQVFTSAVMSLAEERQTRVYFLQGHGEPAPDSANESGIQKFTSFLSRENYQIETFHSLGKENLPEDCDLLIIFSPQTPFVEQEIGLLDRYLSQGGRVLLFMDPVFERNMEGFRATGLEKYLLNKTGIGVGNNIVLDPSHKIPFIGPQTIFVQRFGIHPVTEKMSQNTVIVSLARSISDQAGAASNQTDDKDQPKPAGRRFTLMMTSDEGWGECSMEELRGERNATRSETEDLAGPVSLAVAWESSEKSVSSRAVVFGTSYFATNAQLDSSSHVDLVLNAVRWLTYRESQISITPKTIENSKLALTDEQMANLTRLIMLGIPFFTVVVGCFVYLSRRA